MGLRQPGGPVQTILPECVELQEADSRKPLSQASHHLGSLCVEDAWGLLARLTLRFQLLAQLLPVHLAWPVFSTCVVLASFRHQ